MAMKVEELQVIISANADQFKGQLTSIQKQLSGLPAGMGAVASAGGTMGKAVLGANIAFAVLAGGVALIGKGLEQLNNIVEDSVKTTMKYESALIGLQTVAGKKLGNNAMKDATESAKELASDGLMSVTDSATGLKNLLATGFNLKEANDLMLVFKDSASFGRQGALDFGQAISSATEGVKNGNSILVDNAGITKNLSKILVSAGYAEKDLSRATEDAGVRQALYNGLLEQGNLFQGDAARLANTSAGQIAKLNASIVNLQVSIGQAVKPIQMALNEGVLAFLKGIQLTVNGASLDIANFTAKVAGIVLAFVRVIGRLLSSIPVIGKNFLGMANVSLAVSKAQDKLSTSTGNAGKNIDKAADSAKALKKELMGLASFDEMNVLTSPSSTAGGDVTAGGGYSNSSPLQIDTSTFDANAVNDYADKVTKAFQEIGSKISTFLNPIIESLGVAWKWLNDNIITPVVGFWNRELMPLFIKLGYAVQEIVVVFMQEWVKIEPVLKPLQDAIRRLIVEGFDRLGQVINFVWQNFLKPLSEWLISNLVAHFKKSMSSLGDLIRFLAPIFTWLYNAVADVLNWIVQAIKDVLHWLSTAWADVAFFFWKLGYDMGNIWGGIVGTLRGVWEVIKVIFKQGVNSVIDTINGIIRAINKAIGGISGLSQAMGSGSINFRVGEVPRMAQGGIVSSPTVAMIGEAGREAVIPLDNRKWINELADKINGSGGQSGNIVVNIGEERIYSKFIDYVNNRSKATNSLVFNI
jgi:hypothetical protein